MNLLLPDTKALLAKADGSWHLSGPTPRALLPGSFNPVHAGHWGLAEAAAQILGEPVAFELSLVNVDKPDLSLDEAHHRLLPFHGRADVWLTGAPRFSQKAELFPGTTFIVGADTALRLVSPRYYGQDPALMASALESILTRGCRFLVAARVASTGKCLALMDLDIPSRFAELFDAIPEAQFRLDLSSTDLRRQEGIR